MSVCVICLAPLVAPAAGAHHPRCAKRLFGVSRVPDTGDLSPATLRIGTAAGSVDGLREYRQAGTPVDLSADRRRLQPHAEGRFVIRPQSATLPQLPENELLTMRLAEVGGADVERCGLVRLGDGSLGIVALRSDRADAGIALERQTLGSIGAVAGCEWSDDPAAASAALLWRHASEPLVALLKFYRLLVVAWWLGIEDLDVQTLALVTGQDGVRRLAPASGLVCTRLTGFRGSDAWPAGIVTGVRARADWMRVGETLGLRPRIVERVLEMIASSFDEALGLVSRSLLGESRQVAYAELLGRRTARLER